MSAKLLIVFVLSFAVVSVSTLGGCAEQKSSTDVEITFPWESDPPVSERMPAPDWVIRWVHLIQWESDPPVSERIPAPDWVIRLVHLIQFALFWGIDEIDCGGVSSMSQGCCRSINDFIDVVSTSCPVGTPLENCDWQAIVGPAQTVGAYCAGEG